MSLFAFGSNKKAWQETIKSKESCFELQEKSIHRNSPIDKVNPSQDLQKASSQEEVEEVQKAEVSSPKEINDTLNLAGFFASLPGMLASLLIVLKDLARSSVSLISLGLDTSAF